MTTNQTPPQRLTIVRKRGEPHMVDTSLSPEPILSIPQRLGASTKLKGRGITIAFVDSGFAAHPDLLLPRNRVKMLYDAVSRKEIRDVEWTAADPPSIKDWHGTMVAAVAAGSGRLSDGYYRGLASEASLVFVRAMTHDNRIRSPQAEAALDWILDKHDDLGIDIVNLSLGVEAEAVSKKHRVVRQVEELSRRGIVVVAAVGNTPGKRPVPPGSAPSAITVGGYVDFNRRGRKRTALWHGSYGRFPNGITKPDVLAPSLHIPAPILLHTDVKAEAEALFYMIGGDNDTMLRAIPILAPETNIADALNRAASDGDPDAARSAILTRMKSENVINANYKQVDGTSFASAIVASIVAQLLEDSSDLSPSEVKRELSRSAQPIPGVNAVRQGAGIVRPDLLFSNNV